MSGEPIRPEPAKVRAARREVAAAREAMIETLAELRERLQPKTLASDAWEAAKVKGADLAEDAVDAVKRRPVAAGGIVAALAMFLARAPIKDAAKRAYGAMTSADAADDNKDHEPPAPPPARRRARTTRRAPRKTEKVA